MGHQADHLVDAIPARCPEDLAPSCIQLHINVLRGDSHWRARRLELTRRLVQEGLPNVRAPASATGDNPSRGFQRVLQQSETIVHSIEFPSALHDAVAGQRTIGPLLGQDDHPGVAGLELQAAAVDSVVETDRGIGHVDRILARARCSQAHHPADGVLHAADVAGEALCRQSRPTDGAIISEADALIPAPCPTVRGVEAWKTRPRRISRALPPLGDVVATWRAQTVHGELRIDVRTDGAGNVYLAARDLDLLLLVTSGEREVRPT
mmetsp:Transcript_94678/g.273776  ORF Transcript_94678/g.273776 Transcript_94678/m.273776 type:complete len:265 (-) Transcript_94678:517-1311(-)